MADSGYAACESCASQGSSILSGSRVGFHSNHVEWCMHVKARQTVKLHQYKAKEALATSTVQLLRLCRALHFLVLVSPSTLLTSKLRNQMLCSHEAGL
jgi:hypothetical protein